MNFRFIFTILLLSLLVVGCKPSQQNHAPEFWVWVYADAKKTHSDWERDFQKLSKAGFTGILMGANLQVLEKAIPEAHKNGLELHAWMWTMNRGDGDSTWLSVNQNGQSLAEHKAYVDYYKFMCPALPEVKTFLKAKIDELSELQGLDGIHMDYIRYVDAILPIGLQPKYGLKQDSIFPEFDYGYHPYLVDLYKQKTGIDPLQLQNPATDPDWLQFRLDELNLTVSELRDYIHQHGKKASAAVFPTPAMATHMVRQEWDQWNLDMYFPMVYHNFYEENTDWIKNVMIENKSVIAPSSKVICGLYVPALKNKGDLKKAIQAALDGGADGVALFDYRALSEEMLKDLEEY